MDNYVTKTAKITFIILLQILITIFIIYGFKVLLLILGGVLIALFFEGIASFINSKIPYIKKTYAKILSVLLVTTIIILLLCLLYPRVADQILKLKNELPQAFKSLKETLQANEMVNFVITSLPSNFGAEKISSNLKNFFSSFFGVLGDIYIMIFLGAFFSIQPQIYYKGIVQLLPKNKRSKALEMLKNIAEVLKKWLAGKILSMVIVGVLTGVGLAIIGIPLALTLAIVAAVTAFVPNLGPILALIPALLIAFGKGEQYVLYTFLLYIGIQAIESNLITPYIQKEMISFPMALILIAQVVLGLFTGYLGLILATPVVAIVILMIKELYIKEYLEA